MEIRSLLSIAMMAFATTGFGTVWTITNSGFTFSPDTLIIQVGDTVEFNIQNMHDAVEVSQATWNANGNTQLAGGFAVGFGGGTVLPADLPVGTHYYVCEPHASSGMKGVIIVESSLGVQENTTTPDITVFPNPTNGLFNVSLTPSFLTDNTRMEIFDLAGNLIQQSNFNRSLVEVDLTDRESGFYFIRIQTGSAVLSERIVVK